MILSAGVGEKTTDQYEDVRREDQKAGRSFLIIFVSLGGRGVTVVIALKQANDVV